MPPAKRATTAAKNQARWLSCQSPKGGTGKTTSVLNLATFAARDGLRTAILDTDMQRSLSAWHRLRPADAAPIRLFSRPLTEIEAAIAEIDATPDLDIVLVDTPPAIEYLPQQTSILLERSDFVLVPATTGKPDVDSVIGWMALLKERRIRSAFLINRASRVTLPARSKGAEPAAGTLSFRDAQRRLNKAGLLCPLPVRQLEDIQNTHGYGVGVCEISGAKGAEDFEAAWDFVRNMMGL
ncbi:ParA family protein [Roseomonas sp. USHLN139]|uniref:ParA family protein n=1 Tax=Roseomonas sp. USHLN139 TaxID=3081298 RepID=UPI003B023A28